MGVVKVICHKAHRRRIQMVQCYSTGDGNVSSHEGTLAPPANTIELVHPSPTRVHNRNVKSIGSDVFAQMAAECPYTLQWSTCFPLKIALPMLACRRHVIRGSLGPPESGAQMATLSLQPFFQDSLHRESKKVPP